MSRKRILLLESFIWIIALGGLIHLGVNYLDDKFHQGKIYNFEFNDADSVIVGSPVRIMGIAVGNVTAVNYKNNKASISVKINDESIKIPPSSSISVQFTGLAGSRSIEISPPDKEKEKIINPLNVVPSNKTTHVEENNFKVVEPIRVAQVFDLQKNVSLSVLDLSTNVLKFFGSGGLEKLKNNIKESKTTVANLNNSFSNAKNTMHTISSEKQIMLNNAKANINESETRILDFQNELEKAQTFQNLYILSDYSTIYSSNIDQWRERHLKQVIDSIYLARLTSSSIAKAKCKNTNSMNYQYIWFNSALEQLNTTSNNIDNSVSKEKINTLKHNIEKFNSVIKSIKSKL